MRSSSQTAGIIIEVRIVTAGVGLTKLTVEVGNFCIPKFSSIASEPILISIHITDVDMPKRIINGRYFTLTW
jgi:hypothetical protein